MHRTLLKKRDVVVCENREKKVGVPPLTSPANFSNKKWEVWESTKKHTQAILFYNEWNAL